MNMIKKIRWAALPFAFLFAGCFSIHMEGRDGSHTAEEKGYMQCSAKSVTGVQPVLTYDASSYSYDLELRATGDFVIYDAVKVITKSGLTQRVYFGMFPGFHVERLCLTDRERYEEKIGGDDAYVVGLTLTGFMVGIPLTTAYALFVEPFGEYHTHHGFAGAALLGFSKRLLDEGGTTESVSYRKISSYPSTTAKLYGYRLEIEGKPYPKEDDSSGNISIWIYDFGNKLTSGRRLKAKIVSPPSLLPDSHETLEDLAGVEFEIVCP